MEENALISNDSWPNVLLFEIWGLAIVNVMVRAFLYYGEYKINVW